MNQAATNPRRLGAIVAGVLILAVVIAAVITTTRPVEDLDPNTPEGVVQQFFQAVDGRNWDLAYALLSPELEEACIAADLATAPYEYDRAVIEDVITTRSTTVVLVEVRRVDASDPLNPYTYDEVMEFELDSAGGKPVIARLPWQFYCGD